MGNVVVAAPNELVVISGIGGSRHLIGECGWKFWGCETAETLSLELLTIRIKSTEAETAKGVRVTVESVAQLKVKTSPADNMREAVDRSERQRATGSSSSGRVAGVVNGGPSSSSSTPIVEHDLSFIKLAAQHFLGKSIGTIREQLTFTMEGHQRQILGTLTVEEIYKDRRAFSEKIREHVIEDLDAMGFALVSFTMTNIDDETGYMASLGKTQTALVMREAEEGKARNEAEARIKVAEYKSRADCESAEAMRIAHVQVNKQQELKAQSDRDLDIKRAAFAREVNSANAEAKASGLIESAKQKQAIVRAEQQQRAVEAEIHLDIMDKEVEKEKREREGKSEAELRAQKNRAQAVIVTAEADARRIDAIGRAEAAAIRAKGEAEAEVLLAKANAYKSYGQAAVVSLVVDKLPELAKNIAAPLSNAEKMVFVSTDGGGGGSALTADVARIMAQLPEVVNGLTGVDLHACVEGIAAKQNHRAGMNKGPSSFSSAAGSADAGRRGRGGGEGGEDEGKMTEGLTSL